MPCPWRHPPERSSTQNQCLVWRDRKWKTAMPNGWCLLMLVDRNQWRLIGSRSLRYIEIIEIIKDLPLVSMMVHFWHLLAIHDSLRGTCTSSIAGGENPASDVNDCQRAWVQSGSYHVYVVYVNCRPYDDWLLSFLLGFRATMQLGVCRSMPPFCQHAFVEPVMMFPTHSRQEGRATKNYSLNGKYGSRVRRKAPNLNVSIWYQWKSTCMPGDQK